MSLINEVEIFLPRFFECLIGGVGDGDIVTAPFQDHLQTSAGILMIVHHE